MGNFCFSGFILFPKPLSLRCHDPSLRTADSSGDEEIDASDDPISGTEVRSHLSGRSNHSSWQALCVNDLGLQPATWDVRLRTAARIDLCLARKTCLLYPFRDTEADSRRTKQVTAHTHILMPLRLKLQIPPVHIVSTVKCSADGLGTIEAGILSQRHQLQGPTHLSI
ncbi:hypothetical protein M431DRAFT_490558 [Trichoderma harzianum CBS 226.95]|jgi:hypothetical protein|uniref:Uncharacterized protein n=1 Tax=Trichoderma harzianum CBS 226.95 TaxID=983964 RepID=A0A2T4APB7_TRIHA|nr:hypothetical protein M431DRAFT_490558 [Trichoderma harzianum CBS 226.95]PTB58924.1 hypothetical protein M431DRAFT_490558 [Trichoderma harzianum CBS 226.95]